MRANIVIHTKDNALKIMRMHDSEYAYTDEYLLWHLPDFVFGEGYEAILHYENNEYYWSVNDEDYKCEWMVSPLMVQKVEVLSSD